MPPEWGEWEYPKQFSGDLPTLKLKPRKEICECGDAVCDRRINLTYVQIYKHQPQKFCSRVCQNCNRWYNPQTKQWEGVDVTHYNERRTIIKDFLRTKAK